MGLPEVGDIFAYPVSAHCQVLLRVVAQHHDHRCVVMTRYAGPPVARVPRRKSVFEVQPLTHHARQRPMVGAWIRTPGPSDVRFVGQAPLRPVEASRVVHPQIWVNTPLHLDAKVLPLMQWPHFLREVLLEWRWCHHRHELLVEESAQHNALAQALQAQQRKVDALQSQGVSALQNQRFFVVWEGEKSDQLMATAEAMAHRAVKELMHQKPLEAAHRLRALAQEFRALGSTLGPFDLSDCEDIVDAISTMAKACRIDDETFEMQCLLILKSNLEPASGK